SSQGQPVATLQPGECFGEFPILDPSSNYTVTAVAREQCVVASMPEGKLLSIANKHSEIWKNMARMLVNRVRSANESKPVPTPTGLIKPGDHTIVGIWNSLTVSQFWTIIVVLFSILAGVATVSFKLGTLVR